MTSRRNRLRQSSGSEILVNGAISWCVSKQREVSVVSFPAVVEVHGGMELCQNKGS